MGWKDWPYWLKGGIIVSVFALIFRLAGSMFLLFDSSNIFERILSYISFFLGYPFGIPLANILNTGITIIDFILFLIFYSLIGALIGWIYGKIKSRKSP